MQGRGWTLWGGAAFGGVLVWSVAGVAQSPPGPKTPAPPVGTLKEPAEPPRPGTLAERGDSREGGPRREGDAPRDSGLRRDEPRLPGGLPGFRPPRDLGRRPEGPEGPQPDGPPREGPPRDGPPMWGGPGRWPDAFRGGEESLLEELRKYDPEMYELQKKDLELERQTLEVGQQYRRAPREQRAVLKKQLQELVTQHFEARQARRQLQWKRLAEELERMKRAIDRRTELQPQIVERRVAELIGEQHELDF
ncbi:MAG: hypothetical protein AB7O38_15600 [Pirellulaceae bacterium]